MNAQRQSRQFHSAFDQSADYTFPMERLAPDIAKIVCINFPMQEIAADIGIRDARAVSISEVTGNKIQSLNGIYSNLSMRTFSMLGDCDGPHSALSLDVNTLSETIDVDGLLTRAADGQTYFCANLSVIRDVVEHYSGIVYGDLDEVARALQKALVAKALQSNKPIIIFECLIEDADKGILCKADSFLRDRAANDNEAGSKIGLAREWQSLYTWEDAENPYYPLS